MDFANFDEFITLTKALTESNFSDENKIAFYKAINFARMSLEIIRQKSISYDEGKLSPEEAGVITGFCYIPIRYFMGDLTWKNEKSGRVWSYAEFYDALVKLIRSDQQI